MEEHVPYYMRTQLLYCEQFQYGLNSRTYVVLTKELYLHEVWRHNIMSSCDLSESVFKGLHLEGLSNGDIELNLHFSYVGSTKNVHYILKIKQYVAVISGKSTVHRSLTKSQEFSNVSKIEIVDDFENPGQVILRLSSLEGRREDIAIADVEKHNLNKDTVKPTSMGRIYSTLNDELLKAQSELTTVRLSNEQQYKEIANVLQFGRPGIRGDAITEKTIVAKYGDIWMRINNDRLVIGVPIFNSTFKCKRVAHNIRPTLHCLALPKLNFSFQLYHCKLDASVSPSLDSMIDLDEAELSAKMSFDHEWEPQHVLLPEMAAVLVLTISTPSFVEHAEYNFHVFVHYDVRVPNTDGQDWLVDTLQLNCGRIQVTTEVMLTSDYQLSFNTGTVFKDMLTVEATSQRSIVELEFVSDASSCILDELLVNHLRFVHIKEDSISNITQDAMDIDHYIDNLVDVADLETSSSSQTHKVRLRPCDIFYQPHDGFFKNLLIRRFRKSTQKHVLKIYSSTSLSGARFVQLLGQQCGPAVNITRGESENRPANERKRICQLASAILNEAHYIESNSHTNLDTFMRGRTLCELHTDLIQRQI